MVVTGFIVVKQEISLLFTYILLLTIVKIIAINVLSLFSESKTINPL